MLLLLAEDWVELYKVDLQGLKDLSYLDLWLGNNIKMIEIYSSLYL